MVRRTLGCALASGLMGLAAAGCGCAQEASPLRGEAFIAGKTPVDPPPAEPKNSHAYMTVTGPAALRMYRATRQGRAKPLRGGQAHEAGRGADLQPESRRPHRGLRFRRRSPQWRARRGPALLTGRVLSMFIRFVITDLDPSSGRRQGLFQAARVLRESGKLNADDEERLVRMRGWFNENLERPTCLAISTRAHGREQALSWFKDSAKAHIAKMRELQELLERHGVRVQMITARRLGYVLYEDEFQIAAYSFNDTPT
jgi:hypothetical protein